LRTPTNRYAPRLPHPIPYQGSKRLLADRILAVAGDRKFGVLYEPFAGSGAITIAGSARGLAERYELSDTLAPLVEIWQAIIARPTELADAYETVWKGQLAADSIEHFNAVRSEFNERHDPAKLLYLLARCVKNAPRFNRQGAFNQSPDKRRRGMRPAKMRREIEGVSALLKDRGRASVVPFEQALGCATSSDLVYLDPPWEGTSTGRDRRYHEGLDRERLIEALVDLNERGVPFLLSYDGRHGDKTYGDPLPATLRAERLDLPAGRSAQATLLGRADHTVESLYVSEGLAARTVPDDSQLNLFAA
jgi:DNA adenine methylase